MKTSSPIQRPPQPRHCTPKRLRKLALPDFTIREDPQPRLAQPRKRRPHHITSLPFAYDAANNLTEQGLPAATTKYYTHDAGNRLTELKIERTSLGQYEYNALHWRSAKHSLTPGSGSIDGMRLMYYSANWQLLAERIDCPWTSGFTEDERAQTFWRTRSIDDAVGPEHTFHPRGRPTKTSSQ